jgi:hypothetical protein
MKKTAFSLPEAIIAMAIMGIVVTFGIRASVQNDKAIRHLYSNTYHALDKAFYNAYNFPSSGSQDPFTANNDAQGALRLCRMLTEYINTIEQNPCKADRTLLTDNPADSDFNDDSLQFIATNGIRIYISHKYGVASDPFYLIYVDINGPKIPNSMHYEIKAPGTKRARTVDPDIFAFAAVNFGRIVPLGVPEFDGRYMLSRVQYYDHERPIKDDQQDLLFSAPSQPYYLMRAQAWGYYNTTNRLPDITRIADNPYSYNGYIKDQIQVGSRIYADAMNTFFGGYNNTITVPASGNLRSASVSNGGYNCERGTDENACDVIIDNYVY